MSDRTSPVQVLPPPIAPRGTIHVLHGGPVSASLTAHEAKRLVRSIKNLLKDKERFVLHVKALRGVVEVALKRNAPIACLIARIRTLRLPSPSASLRARRTRSSGNRHQHFVRAVPTRRRRSTVYA